MLTCGELVWVSGGGDALLQAIPLAFVKYKMIVIIRIWHCLVYGNTIEGLYDKSDRSEASSYQFGV